MFSMDRMTSTSAIDQKMVEMRIKNLELLKRHQEIEEDRQLAVRLGASKKTEAIADTAKYNNKMRGTVKNASRMSTNQQVAQESQNERKYRPPTRRKFEYDRNDTQPQRAQRVDYSRLKRERTQELNNQKQNDNTNEIDEPTHAKKLVIVNNKADRIGSGRFTQQQRAQERGQQKREERLRRSHLQNNGHAGTANEFHLDVPDMPLWQNSSMPVQFLPTNVDHHLNKHNEQMDQSPYLHNFVYSSSPSTSTLNSNATIYFTNPMSSVIACSSSQTAPHFHRTFDNANHHHHYHKFQSSLVQPSVATPSITNIHQQENLSTDFSSNHRRFKLPDHEVKLTQQRPMSGDFERLQATHNTSLRFNFENRFQTRPQSFYDFSSYQTSNNNNLFRPLNTNRHQRNHNSNTSLPLSAYMTTDDSLNDDDATKQNNNNNNNNNNSWTSAHQRRRPTQTRTHHQEKHQFPLSLYDPRQYGFSNNYQRRNDSNNRLNINQRNVNNNDNNNNNNEFNKPKDIDVIEEWWEDNSIELASTKESKSLDSDSKITTINDSGHSSLSTSMHLKESTLDDISTPEFINPSSDVSTTDSHIIESLDKLQQQLKLEEAVDERLASNESHFNETMDTKSNKETVTYDTTHFMQWAKEKFREELAGRLTAQEIQQQDAVVSEDDDDVDHHPPTTQNDEGKLDTLEDDLNEKLTIDENPSQTNSTAVAE